MDASGVDLWSWILGLSFAVIMPWTAIRATHWIVLRCAEERLQAIPFSVWQPLYNRLLQVSSSIMLQLSDQVSRLDLFSHFNPERCTQQTLKVLIPYTEALTDQLVRPLSPVLWDNTPLAMRLPIYQRVAKKFRPCIDKLVLSLETIITSLFDHAAFITNQLQRQETGYRFIGIEALHHYWHGLFQAARSLSISATIIYLILCALWPSLNVNIMFLVIPLVITGGLALRAPAVVQSNQKAFARCLGFWFGERIYMIDDMVRYCREGGCDQVKLRALINHAFQPLIEDAPLKTLAQVALGRHALINLRAGLVNYMMDNGSIPFEHTQFRLERAQEVRLAYETNLGKMPIQTLNTILQPMMSILRSSQSKKSILIN